MDKITYITTDKSPKAIGSYSQAIKYRNFIFCSGQIGLNPTNGKVIGKTIEDQTGQVIKNLLHILEATGSSLDKVIKTTVYLKNIEDFAKFNRVYEKYFSKHKPARTTVAVANLPKDALIEIEAIATAD